MDPTSFALTINNLKGIDVAVTSSSPNEFIVALDGKDVYKVTMEQVDSTGDLMEDLEKNIK